MILSSDGTRFTDESMVLKELNRVVRKGDSNGEVWNKAIDNIYALKFTIG